MTADTTTLHTDRLLLRPVAVFDADALFAIYAGPEVAFFMLSGEASREETMRELATARPWKVRPHWVIVYEGQAIGDIVLEVDEREGTANLVYAIARECWGRGFATEATKAVVNYGFRELRLAKVYARADPRNVGSVRVMEKVGMVKEAHLRSHFVRRGERCDRVWYGILRDEWERGVG